MTLSNRKERRVVIYDDATKAVDEGRGYIKAGHWKRVHLDLFGKAPGVGHDICGTITMTPPKKDKPRLGATSRSLKPTPDCRKVAA